MTDLTSPESARVFIVGRNQRTTFCADQVGDHDAFIDALFNRNGKSCRQLYAQMRKNPSPTRKNICDLRAKLASEGIHDVMETNVICYSTPMSADLARAKNEGGREAGEKIFRELLTVIRPKVLIAHGAGTARDLGRILAAELPAAPKQSGVVSRAHVKTQLSGESFEVTVFAIPSLAPPAWNKWLGWAPSHLTEICKQARDSLDRSSARRL
jgi:hypothetical protein